VATRNRTSRHVACCAARFAGTPHRFRKAGAAREFVVADACDGMLLVYAANASAPVQRLNAFRRVQRRLPGSRAPGHSRVHSGILG
jgi:hypothetical protein